MKILQYSLTIATCGLFLGCGDTSNNTSKPFTITTHPSTIKLIAGMKKDILLNSDIPNIEYEILDSNGNAVLYNNQLILRADNSENGTRYVKIKALNPIKNDSSLIELSYSIIPVNTILPTMKIIKTGADDGGFGIDRNFTLTKSNNTEYVVDPLGNQWTISTEKKPFEIKTYLAATTECQILKSLNKNSNWQIPTKDELLNLIDYSKKSGTNMIESIFGDKNINSTWAKSENGKNLVVSQYNALINYIDTYNFQKYPVRCINPKIKDKTHIVSTDRGTGETYDYSTGLIWLPIQEKRKLIDENNETAFEYCENLNFNNKTGWRLPNINELRSINEDGMISYFIRGINTVLVSSTPYNDGSNNNEQKAYYSLFIQNGIPTTGISPANNSYGISCIRNIEP